MRIIDKNKDFYDYNSNIYIDNTITFDRRGSYFLTERDMYMYLPFKYQKWVEPTSHLIVQSGYNYWVFKITPDYGRQGWGTPQGYSLYPIEHFRDYSLAPNPLTLKFVIFRHSNEPIHQAIKHNNYKLLFTTAKIDGTPILAKTQLTKFIDAFELYSSIEEYLSHMREQSERTESRNYTDLEKISSHGFDTITSFRGKRGK